MKSRRETFKLPSEKGTASTAKIIYILRRNDENFEPVWFQISEPSDLSAGVQYSSPYAFSMINRVRNWLLRIFRLYILTF